MKNNQTNNMTNANTNNNGNAAKNAAGMNQFKYEVANELGVPLKDGYNGNLTSAQAGSIGGEMVRQMIQNQENLMSGNQNQQ